MRICCGWGYSPACPSPHVSNKPVSFGAHRIDAFSMALARPTEALASQRRAGSADCAVRGKRRLHDQNREYPRWVAYSALRRRSKLKTARALARITCGCTRQPKRWPIRPLVKHSRRIGMLELLLGKRSRAGALSVHHLQSGLSGAAAQVLPCERVVFFLLGLQLTGKACRLGIS